ncbi:MAG: UDP-glucose 4-epimerase GalE [Oscillospiraceae bacterium]|nr:UDP-glucose 4-epimerase GalE [Oscillospiraceae bacterium]
MAILITGGAGYIGSHTVVELILSGYEVVVADDYSNSSPEVIERIGKIVGRAVPAVNIDVKDETLLEKIFLDYDIDAVIHFAGFKAVGESVSAPRKYYRNNLGTVMTLLDVMEKYHINKFVFSSSATVYNAEDIPPFTENMPVGNCTNPYGRTKYFIEEILRDIAASNPSFSAVLLRYFNPIGAHESGLIGESPNGIPNNLLPYITQTAAGLQKCLNVYGNDYPTPDGTGIRDYIHVADLAKGHVKALEYTFQHAGAEAINLGTGVGYSVLDLLHTFEKVNKATIPYVIVPRRPGDVAKSFADTSKAERLLDWKAEKSIDDMCRDCWRWQQLNGK